jgi:UDP-glucose 4-epimerase
MARRHAAEERAGHRRVILVTGGLGYIGSHACVVLAEAGYELVIVDNLANAKLAVLDRLRQLVPPRRVEFERLDLRDRRRLGELFSRRAIEAVVHFAGLKAVGESVEQPLRYYENNVGGTLALLFEMEAHKVRRMVFSSSATVYGEPERLPLAEDHPLRPANPYGKSKLMIEHLLADHASAQPSFRYAALRYFNPIGAHPSGRIGEDPLGVPNNLFPYLAQVAIGKRATLRVWGNDYATPDGTGVRDYIHVMDLAHAHLAALEYLEKRERSITANVGTGRGYSVLESVRAFERACGRTIALEMHPRRSGDVAACYADASLAERELSWRAKLGLDEMCRDAWRWQAANPDGFV